MHIFFRKPFFWHPDKLSKNIFAPLHTICDFKHTPKHYKIGENKQKKSWTKFWPNLGPSFDSKNPNLGPSFDSTAYLYIVSLVVILSNWVCDNWVYRFPTKGCDRAFFLDALRGVARFSSDTAKTYPLIQMITGRKKLFSNYFRGLYRKIL